MSVDSDLAGLGSYGAAPASALNVASRRKLGLFLDPPTTATNTTGLGQFWEGLAQVMGCDYQDIKNLDRYQEHTIELLEQWTKKKGSTVGQLWDYLSQLEMYNIIEDENFREMIINDVKVYQTRQRERYQDHQPVQVNEVHSSGSYKTTDHHVNEFATMTVGEVKTGKREDFDAFVCYTYKDIAFVKQMIHMLEGVHNLKLCINARDLLPGSSEHTVTAKLIEERCKKMLVILSMNFLESPECDFQTKFAHSLSPGSRSKKLVPILVENCQLPNILRHITLVDYTKYDLLEWFWERLANSLREPIPFAFDEPPDPAMVIEIPPPHPQIHVEAINRERSSFRRSAIVNLPSVPSGSQLSLASAGSGRGSDAGDNVSMASVTLDIPPPGDSGIHSAMPQDGATAERQPLMHREQQHRRSPVSSLQKGTGKAKHTGVHVMKQHTSGSRDRVAAVPMVQGSNNRDIPMLPSGAPFPLYNPQPHPASTSQQMQPQPVFAHLPMYPGNQTQPMILTQVAPVSTTQNMEAEPMARGLPFYQSAPPNGAPQTMYINPMFNAGGQYPAYVIQRPCTNPQPDEIRGKKKFKLPGLKTKKKKVPTATLR